MFNYYYYTNSYYMLGNILVLVGVALMALAQMKVSSAYNKYSKVQNSRHLTGYDVAREILDQHGLSSVQIFEVQGRLSDHYNPSNQTLHHPGPCASKRCRRRRSKPCSPLHGSLPAESS